MNIPIYRANIENSNNYITGNLRKILTADSDVIMIEGLENLARIGINQGLYKIDETTLAIHFPYMLDSEGNKIFASFNEDGKGGDICEINVIDAFLEKNYNIKSPILITQKGLKPMEYLGFANFKIIKAIGIQE